MKSAQGISKSTIDRLPLYYRTLRQIEQSQEQIISSEELGRLSGCNSAQVRKDLAIFGEFGKKGIGYNLSDLIQTLGKILALNRGWRIGIVGVGHLGWALANYPNFADVGFALAALFDSQPDKIGQTIQGLSVNSIAEMPDIIRKRIVHIGIITVPASDAQEIADRLVTAGVLGIWNFAPIKLRVPDSVQLVSEDLSCGLCTLSYYLSRANYKPD